jgi:hypothetical protein
MLAQFNSQDKNFLAREMIIVEDNVGINRLLFTPVIPMVQGDRSTADTNDHHDTR